MSRRNYKSHLQKRIYLYMNNDVMLINHLDDEATLFPFISGRRHRHSPIQSEAKENEKAH